MQTQLWRLNSLRGIHIDEETRFKKCVDESYFGHCCFLVGDNSRDSSDNCSRFFDDSQRILWNKCPFFRLPLWAYRDSNCLTRNAAWFGEDLSVVGNCYPACLTIEVRCWDRKLKSFTSQGKNVTKRRSGVWGIICLVHIKFLKYNLYKSNEES